MKSKLGSLTKKVLVLVLVLAIMLFYNALVVFASPLDSSTEVTYALDKTEITLFMNESTTLTINSSMQNYEVSWSSSDTNVATVDNDGKIIAVDKGTATIKATIISESINKELSCFVNVVYKEFETVSDMKAANLKVGEIVSTNGFHQSSIGGATYEIISGSSNFRTDEMGVIRLNNGKKAKIKIINDSVTVEQFGAYADDNIDDARCIQAALNARAADYDNDHNILPGLEARTTNVEFQQGKYKCTTNIKMNTPNVNIIGNSATLSTDDDYTSTSYYFFKVEANNTTISAITISAMETEVKGYNTQLGISNCSNVSITNSSFIVPDRDLFIYDTQTKKSYSNIDLFTYWHNITIDNCIFTLRHRGPIGGCIWIRDYDNLGCDNLTFTNNTCTKSCNDEILALFKGRIKNVTIDNNTFNMYEEYILNERASYEPSGIAFTLSSPYSVLLENKEHNNINFTRNKVNVETTRKLFNFGNVNGILIADNIINYKHIVNDKNPPYLFYSYPRYKLDGENYTECISDNIEIRNNTIRYNTANDREYELNKMLIGDYIIEGNTIGLLPDIDCQWE